MPLTAHINQGTVPPCPDLTFKAEVTFCVQGVVSPLLSNIYIRRFIVGGKELGFARRFGAEIVSYADDFCMLGEAPAEKMLPVVIGLMGRLKLKVNEQETRCLTCPGDEMVFLGYRFGWNYRPNGGDAYIGNRPSKASIQSICRQISEQTHRRYEMTDPEWIVDRLNRMMIGWAQFFQPGQVSSAAATVALSNAQGEEWEARALLRRMAVGALWTAPPRAND